MRTVQAAEAETRLAELLREVEEGESVAIARDGKTVAHIVPAAAPSAVVAPGKRRGATARLMQLRSELRLAPMTREEILASRHDGHRW